MQLSHSSHGVGVGPFYAVERLGEDAGGAGLADAAGAGEEVGVGDAAGLQRVDERRGDVFLADQVGELLRPVAPRDDGVLRRGRAGQATRCGRGLLALRHRTPSLTRVPPSCYPRWGIG